jgi:hypothetical protein
MIKKAGVKLLHFFELPKEHRYAIPSYSFCPALNPKGFWLFAV